MCTPSNLARPGATRAKPAHAPAGHAGTAPIRPPANGRDCWAWMAQGRASGTVDPIATQRCRSKVIRARMIPDHATRPTGLSCPWPCALRKVSREQAREREIWPPRPCQGPFSAVALGGDSNPGHLIRGHPPACNATDSRESTRSTVAPICPASSARCSRPAAPWLPRSARDGSRAATPHLTDRTLPRARSESGPHPRAPGHSQVGTCMTARWKPASTWSVKRSATSPPRPVTPVLA